MLHAPRSTKRRIGSSVGLIVTATLLFGVAACSSSETTATPRSNSSSTTPAGATRGSALVFDPADYQGLSATLKGSGSSFQKNYANGAIETLTGALGGLKISYAGGGSGQGKSDLADGVVDYAGTDSQISKDNLSKYDGKVLYFPTVLAPITVSYNLAGVDNLKLDGPTLAKIFTRKVTTWNDPVIANINSGVVLPDTPITVCRRSDASGTTSNFTAFLESAGGDAWGLGSGDTVKWPNGTQGAQGNGGVAACITKKEGTVGYVDYSDAKAQNLTYAPIKNRAGEFIEPTLEGASAAADGVEIEDDLTYSPIDASGAESYPIASSTWIIVMAQQSDATKAEALRAFLGFILTDGQDASFTASLNYAPLPKSLDDKALAQIDEIQAS